MDKVIGILAGSLRKASFSKKIAEAIIEFAPEGYEFKMVSLEDLPIYNQDFDDYNDVPQAIHLFRETMKGISGVIFVTPEYNRSVPGVLKNAIDVGSRPYNKSIWDKKPAAVFSNSPGHLSGFGANHHLRQSLVFLNMPTMQQPEVYLAQIKNDIDENGHLKEGDTKAFLKKAVAAYISWFEKNAV
ncbi:NADPH-dependent FMN reductase [Polluticaenibacter yanchengensis]|uniref:NAD(P)H-dependent oxidoreductase n=1 Tax=Polluticaenibacter yanchengensis TaxID=3014562 RepID=A0ABT4ULF4_9BACT|nr:NAD(P)H-dependent oxidoreductase [Chitinophagaceae bacterium LY-5]